VSNPFQPYTHAIVSKLIKMPKVESRAWFVAILAYITRATGDDVKSIHDYVTKPVVSDAEERERREILSAVAGALNAGDLALLNSAFEE
jgi:hypothetical protein